MARQRNSDIGITWTSFPVVSSRVASRRTSRRRSHSSSGSYRRMANGRSWYTLIRCGMAFRSFSRRSTRSLSEDMRVLLKGLGGERQPGHAARRVVLQQAVLVGVVQEPLDGLRGQEEQLPVGQSNQLGPRGLVLLEVEGEVGERLDRQVRRGDPLLDRPLQDAEVPQRGQEALRDAHDG